MLECLARLVVVSQPLAYALSWLGIIDFLSVLPTLVALGFAGSRSLLVIRPLRLRRVFRIFRLGQFVGESAFIVNALRASRLKILVFLAAMFRLAVATGQTLASVLITLGYAIIAVPTGIVSAQMAVLPPRLLLPTSRPAAPPARPKPTALMLISAGTAAGRCKVIMN